MYIDHISRKPSIREALRIDVVQAKNVNMKKLKMLDKQAAKDFQSAKFHGGKCSLGRGFGSWLKGKFSKVKNFATKAFNNVIKPVYKKVLKPALTFATKNELGKQLTQGASSIIGSAVSAIPVVGPIAGPVVSTTLPTVLNTADDISTAAEKIVQSIREKNPQLTVQQAKEVYNTIKNTYNKLDEQAKKLKEEQTNKAMQKLPDTIKAQGFEAVLKAAPFLPLVDLTTLREDSSTTKGGRVRNSYKIRKPKDADKFGKYSPAIVGRVCGAMFFDPQVLDPQVLDPQVSEGGLFSYKSGSVMDDKVISKSKMVESKKPISKNLDMLKALRNKYAK